MQAIQRKKIYFKYQKDGFIEKEKWEIRILS